MNDPQILVTNSANPTGVWIDLTECSTLQEFEALADEQLNTETLDIIVSDSADVPKCFIKNGMLSPEAIDFAQKDEEQRTIIFAYSTISTDIDQYLAQNAENAFWGTAENREEFAKGWTQAGFDLADVIYDSLDWTKLATKLEDLFIFVDIASKTYVFNK